MPITAYKEAKKLQSSCISLPTATVPTHVVWQTKCELVTCISYVSCVFALQRAYAKIACNGASTCQFLLIKHASTRIYLHACVKFKLSCTVLQAFLTAECGY